MATKPDFNTRLATDTRVDRFKMTCFCLIFRYKVLSVTPRNLLDVLHLHKLRDETTDLDFWKQSTKPGQTAEIMVAPEFIDDFVEGLDKRGMKVQVQITNVQE